MSADSPHHNPYDFANPVTDVALLADRNKERNEIDYYLKHAASAPRPINIALIGNRASGKTSLLNYAEVSKRKSCAKSLFATHHKLICSVAVSFPVTENLVSHAPVDANTVTQIFSAVVLAGSGYQPAIEEITFLGSPSS
jgi:Cdc6-like AAA superfamily ATPase